MPKCEICRHKKTKFFHKINNFSYYFCRNCGTLFLNPKPSQKFLENYYAKKFAYSAGEENEMLIRQRAISILTKLKHLNPKGSSLLDIGSGYSFFIDEAKKLGFEVKGIEPSKELFRNSVNYLTEFVNHETFEEFYLKNRNKKFDFITLIHVIEHVSNPIDTINKAIKLLKPRGILYIETPNLDSHLFYSEKYNYTFLTPPDHLWLFSQTSLKKILTKIPDIQIEKINTYSYPEHLMGIIKRKFQLSKSKFQTNSSIQRTNSTNLKNLNLKFDSKFIKYIVLDKFLAPLLTPLLNIHTKGSILELYIRKK